MNGSICTAVVTYRKVLISPARSRGLRSCPASDMGYYLCLGLVQSFSVRVVVRHDTHRHSRNKRAPVALLGLDRDLDLRP